MLKYVLAWVAMVPLAIVNGIVREKWFAPHLSELAAHQASTGSLLLLVGIYTWVVLKVFRPESARDAVVIGLWWLGLTVGFEFSFGHYVAGHSWSRLLADYNILAGRLWIFIPGWMAIAPAVFHRLRAGRP